jgi:hypothetical protein
VVDVEQAALRAFEQQVLARAVGLVQAARHIGNQRQQARSEAHRFVERLLEIHLGLLVIVGQHEVVEVENLGQLLGEAHRLEEILEPQRPARDLVLVGRADAAAGGADLLRPLGGLAGEVQGGVVGQDQRAGFRDAQPRRDRHARGAELVHLLDQGLRRKHHPVADVAIDAIAQDARGYQVQDGLLGADHQRMAGVVAALEAHHALGPVGKPVDDLALALVAPLRADHHYIACRSHLPFFSEASARRSMENPVAGRARPKALPTSS